MLNYECKLCDYITDRLYNLNLHKKSKKHLKNALKHEENVQILQNNNDDMDTNNQHKISKKMVKGKKKSISKCPHCGHTFSCYKSLWRHKKYYCNNVVNNVIDESANSDVISKDSDIPICKVKEQNKELKKRNKELAKQNKDLLELAKKNADVSGKNADVSIITAKSAKKSMSMMSHAMKHFANAPPIKMLEGKQQHAKFFIFLDNPLIFFNFFLFIFPPSIHFCYKYIHYL
jgi:hypothetical protein